MREKKTEKLARQPKTLQKNKFFFQRKRKENSVKDSVGFFDISKDDGNDDMKEGGRNFFRKFNYTCPKSAQIISVFSLLIYLIFISEKSFKMFFFIRLIFSPWTRNFFLLG